MQKLKWSTIEQRRIWTDVTLMYKEVNQLKALKADPISYQPSLATVRGTRNSHCLKFVPYHCRINVYQLLFFFSKNNLPLEHSTRINYTLTIAGAVQNIYSEPPTLDHLLCILRYKQWHVQCLHLDAIPLHAYTCSFLTNKCPQCILAPVLTLEIKLKEQSLCSLPI